MELERVKEVFQIPLSGGSDSGGTKAFHYTNELSLH